MTADASGTNNPNRLATRPPQRSGSVRSSGSSWVSASMNASAISVHRNAQAARPVQVGPNVQIAASAATPAASSTIGYLAEMRVPHPLQRPRSASHETIGMFSSGVSTRPQPGHAERGTTRS